MLPLRSLGRVAVLAAALPLSGCAALFGGYDVAPNGLPQSEATLRHDLESQPAAAYASVIEGDRELPDDDLLRLLYAGTAGRYAGEHREGAHLLDLASYVADDRVTTSVSRELLSLVASDRALAYAPSRTERLMIPYLAAATYLEAGDLQGATVEARRIEALLDRIADRDGTNGEGAGLPAGDRRFLHTFAATIFEAAGDRSAAEVAYRRAGLQEDAAVQRVAGTLPGDSMGEVVVLVESGFVPHQVEQSVVVVLPPWQLAMLTEGSAGEMALAATEAAARVLLTANQLYGDRSGYYRDRGYRHPVHLEPWDARDPRDCRERGDDGCERSYGNPYLLRISWPVLFQETAAAAPVRVRTGELGVDALARFDVAARTRQDFEAQRGTMVARTMLRAASKVALSAAAQNAVEKKDAAAGQLVGFLANVGTLLSERADTRCWHLLPGTVSMARLRLPPGTHELTVDLDQGTGTGRTLSLGTATVTAGGTTFVTHRIWR